MLLVWRLAVKYTYENLDEFLKGGFSKNTQGNIFSAGILDDLKMLQNHAWRGKKIKLCLNGDYDFLCKVFGISGATGKFPCIWCLVPSDELDKNDKEYTERTIQSLTEDHER